MALLNSKWGLIILGLVLILVLLFVLGRKSVRAEIQINASPDQVWAVLTDISAVKEWNKVLIPVDGNLETGSTLKYEFYQEEGGKAAVMDARVRQMVKPEMINQAGGLTGILTFDHRYILQPSENGTLVTIHEKYRGIMVPFWNPAPVEKAYERLLFQLKDRAEG